MIKLGLLIIIAYLIGSIPTAVWVGKFFYSTDIREHGSRNAGATNTIRILGWKAGIPVFLIDILKGFLAASLVTFSIYKPDTNSYINFQLFMGFLALLGHIFPIFAKFKGGKGVATLLGVVIALSTAPAFIAFGIFLIALFLFKYVSLGSIIAGLSYPINIFLFFPASPISIKIAAIVMSIALIITHRKNIGRLIKGTEPKAGFLLKKPLPTNNLQ